MTFEIGREQADIIRRALAYAMVSEDSSEAAVEEFGVMFHQIGDRFYGFEVVSVEVNSEASDCFDVSIRDNATGEIMVADMVKIWDTDQDSLRDMFHAVKAGEW